MARTVHCKKLNHEAPGLDFVPFDDELGARIYDDISEEAWRMWIEHSKRLINEYRLDLVTPEAFHMLHQRCEEFLFGGGEDAPPPMYKPPEHAH